jgi:hypothetical protein
VANLAAAGCLEAALWVLDGNDRDRRFHAAAGWRPDGAMQGLVRATPAHVRAAAAAVERGPGPRLGLGSSVDVRPAPAAAVVQPPAGFGAWVRRE